MSLGLIFFFNQIQCHSNVCKSHNLFEATFFSSFLYAGKRPDENMDIMVLETDYSSYAMLVFKRAGKITMKLYGRF